MQEDNQFHLTVVTQKRRHDPNPEETSASKRTEHRSGHSGQHRAHHSGASHTHHRHYEDYGTVELGTLKAGRQETAQELMHAAPSNGQLQREFLDKYDPVLSRRFSTRNRNKLTRMILIGILCGLIVIAGLIWIFSIKGEVNNPLQAPEVETIPAVSLDLG